MQALFRSGGLHRGPAKDVPRSVEISYAFLSPHLAETLAERRAELTTADIAVSHIACTQARTGKTSCLSPIALKVASKVKPAQLRQLPPHVVGDNSRSQRLALADGAAFKLQLLEYSTE